MPIPVHHKFDGQMLTIAEIKMLVPILSATAIRNHLKAGRNTREAILNYDTNAARAAGSRRVRKTNPFARRING